MGMGWRSILLIVISVAWCFAAGWWFASWRQADTAAPSAGAFDPNCSFAMAGSNTIGERLAPALVAAYFRDAGFEVADAQATADGEVRLTATKDDQSCAVDIRSHGSSLSFEELTANSAAIGMSSRGIRSEEAASLKAAGAGDLDAEAALAEHVVALDGIAIIVHPSNPARTLSRGQVRNAFLRQVRGWAVIGGGAAPVNLYARDDQSGTFQFFFENVLADDVRWDAAKSAVRRFESSSDLVTGVAADVSSLGFVGMAYVNDSVRALPISDGGPAFAPSPNNVRSESYPISRRLYLYVRPDTMRNNPAVAAIIAYAKSPAAYEVVEQLGYVSLREMGIGGPDQRSVAVEPLFCESDAPETLAYRVATRNADRLDSVIRFMPGSNTLDSLARDDVGRAAAAIRAALTAGRTVTLIGHSDGQGDADVNRRLAMQRAATIREAFEAQALLGLQLDSAGERCPVASNDTPQGRQSNRRVEIWISRGI